MDSGKGPLWGCKLPTSCILTWWKEQEKSSKRSWDSYKGTNPVHQGSTLRTSSNSVYLSKIPHTARYGFNICIRGDTNFSPLHPVTIHIVSVSRLSS